MGCDNQTINPWTTIEAPAKPEWLTEEIEKDLLSAKLPLNSDGLLMLHQTLKAQLDHFKEREMTYRKVTAKVLVPNAHEGMNTVELGNGYQAKVAVKYNYKLDSDNDKIWEGLDKIKALGNEGSFVSDRLVSWQPNFLLTEYRQLQEDAEKGSQFAKDALRVIEGFLTISEAAPTLEIKEPKKVRK